jgi:KTSC domain
MSTITLTPANSSAIKGYAYDPAAKVLHLQFKQGGKVTPHYGVPAEKAAGLATAQSMGRYFRDEILGKYPTKAPE